MGQMWTEGFKYLSQQGSHTGLGRGPIRSALHGAGHIALLSDFHIIYPYRAVR